LYLGAVLAGAAAFRERGAARAVEPAIAFGTLIFICEGLSERFFPGVFHLTRDPEAAGRLSQPLTYWNAMGIAAAIGFVLFVRVAGDRSRPGWLRVASVAAAPPVALGLYLTLSRGALLAAAIGLILLVLLAADRDQGLAVIVALFAVAPAILAAAGMSDVRSLAGTAGARETDGLVQFFAVAASAVGAAAWMARRLRLQIRVQCAAGPDPTVRRIAVAGAVAVAVAAVVVFTLAATERVGNARVAAATSARLATTDSIRANFWSVAVRGFEDHPIRGLGAGGFETEWRRYRTVLYSTRDAHSLYLETLSELGLAGAAALIALVCGVALCARRVYRTDPALCTGWIAVVSMFAVHAGLDWDWEMPAVTLAAFLFVAAIVAQADEAEVSAVVGGRDAVVADDRVAAVGVQT
jgi:O-antigen ligase